MANMTFGVNLIPNENNAHSLGNSSKKWDLYARKMNNLLIGTGTTGTNGSSSTAYTPTLWTFNLNITPSEGDIITIKIPAVGVNSGVWMSVDNGTNYYPVAVKGSTRLTTQFDIDQIITLVYLPNQTITTYGTTISGAAAGSSLTNQIKNQWVVLNYHSSNMTVNQGILQISD